MKNLLFKLVALFIIPFCFGFVNNHFLNNDSIEKIAAVISKTQNKQTIVYENGQLSHSFTITSKMYNVEDACYDFNEVYEQNSSQTKCSSIQKIFIKKIVEVDLWEAEKVFYSKDKTKKYVREGNYILSVDYIGTEVTTIKDVCNGDTSKAVLKSENDGTIDLSFNTKAEMVEAKEVLTIFFNKLGCKVNN